MIADLLPAACAVAESFDESAEAELFPQEAALMEGRSPRRRRQFATGRACARSALASLGVPPVPLLRGPGGAPAWPSGVVGSITHCDGFLAAAAARACDVAGLGIDAEPALALPEGVRSLVAVAEEHTALARLEAASAALPWDRLLFCAKEAAYKAWFPRSLRWSALRDVHVRLDPGGGFAAWPPGSPGPAGAAPPYRGRWSVRSGLLVAAALAPTPSAVESRSPKGPTERARLSRPGRG